MKALGGVIVPLFIPFRNGKMSLRTGTHIVGLYEAGVQAVFAGSSVGRGPAMEEDDLDALVNVSALAFKNRMVLANVSDTGTQRSITKALRYFGLGVDAVVSTPPFYYAPRPDQPELAIRHFTAIGEVGPFAMYDMPGRHLPITLEVVREVARHPNCIGIKYSGSSVEHVRTLLEIRNSQPDRRFKVTVGSQEIASRVDALGLINEMRPDGIVVASANIAPGPWLKYWEDTAKTPRYFATLLRLLDGSRLDRESETIAHALQCLLFGDGSLPEPYEYLGESDRRAIEAIIDELK